MKVEERSTTRTVTHPQRGEITQTKVTRKVTYTEKQVKRVLHTRDVAPQRLGPRRPRRRLRPPRSHGCRHRPQPRVGASGHETLPSPKPRKTMRSLPWRRTSRGSDDFEEATSSGGVPTSYAAFISYYWLEAGSDARFLQGALAAAFRQPVFLDATDADELRAILTDGVGRSDAVVALQTKRYLQRPWCLAELYVATRSARPIVPVVVDGRGYDFAEAKKFLSDLPAELEKANPGGVAELEAQPRGSSRRPPPPRWRRAARDAAQHHLGAVRPRGHRQPGRRRRPRDRR